MNRIDEYISESNWVQLLKFILDTILNILRTKLVDSRVVSGQLARGADDLVMLEMCTTHKIISYPDFIQITQVLNVSHQNYCSISLNSILFVIRRWIA